MFWRFGFHNASSIDGLLDKDDVSLEAILDKDDLLQECKSQNTRLIDYFQRVDVLQKLFGYVTGQIEDEDKGRFKYPFVATEVLCSEVWSIVETCVNHYEQLLVPFWETVLEKTPEEMRTQVSMASHFAKINAVFLSRKPAEMLAFVQSQSSVVERILFHIETPPFVDLLIRIIQLDELPEGAGVLEWLSREHLMTRLIDLLSPSHSSDVHTVAADVIKGIISMATPSPGAGLTEGLQNGPASNRFARELARHESVDKLVGYMLVQFGEGSDIPSLEQAETLANESATGSSAPLLPNSHSCASSVMNSISVIIELIRKNNSDYFEPFLFHTLRNRLIQVQQTLHTSGEESREKLEQAMKEMVDRMGVVHLGSVLEVMCNNLSTLQEFLRHPRSLSGPISTTVGKVTPLTYERYRICELFAELLHCSNMSLLNRSSEFDKLYDSEGRLQGGLSALEELARVIAIGSGEGGESEAMNDDNDEIEPAMELPVSGASYGSPSLSSDDSMSDDEPGSSDDDMMEEIGIDEDGIRSSTGGRMEDTVTSSPKSLSIPSSPEVAPAQSLGTGSLIDSEGSTVAVRSHSSRRSSRRMNAAMDVNSTSQTLPIGEKLKRKFLDLDILSSLLDLFFEFPWNNFLHSAVYDILHQILTGRVEGGLNRELTISLFRNARLMRRITEGQNRNDVECAKPKGVRLGYMGHLTLISEDVIRALEHFPPDLRLIIVQYAPQPDWDDYVTGRYKETKKKDSALLGGGKPVIASGAARPVARWRVDDEDLPATGAIAGGELKGEFRRSNSLRPSRERSADFGPAPMEEDEDDDSSPQFARYLAQEMHSSDSFGSSDDDEEDDGGWLSHSSFGGPPVSARSSTLQRRPLGASGFDDSFAPTPEANNSIEDPFASADDENFGPFSDPAADGSDPFTFNSFSDEIDDHSFDSFGDFGEFQSAQSGEGELTPTAGSWTLAGGSSVLSDESGPEVAEEFKFESFSPGERSKHL